jgi:stage II sporulation protein AA (anti-sigma F factor antagonist)
MTGHREGLAIVEGLTPEGIVFRAIGTIDTETAASVAAALDAVWDTPSRSPVIVDLAGVHFMDSAGLGALLMARLRAQDAGREFRVASPQPAVERLLHVTGLHHLLVHGA